MSQTFILFLSDSLPVCQIVYLSVHPVYLSDFLITSALWPPCSCLNMGKTFSTRETVCRPTPAKIYGAREPVRQFPRNFKVKAANYRNTASTTKPYFYPWYIYQMVAQKAMRTLGQICPLCSMICLQGYFDFNRAGEELSQTSIGSYTLFFRI